ncbi:MAG: SET domain-containing protein [Nannocystaceae bacterium]
MSNSSQPLNYTITHRFEALDLSEEEFARIIALATWQKTPKFYKRGRMALHTLDRVVSPTKDSAVHLRAVKMKGVGAYNPPAVGSRFRDPLLDHYTEEPIPPTTKPLTSFVTYPHFGVGRDGEYMFAYSDLAPVGGILLDRALLEYRNAKTLLEHGVASIVPLAVLQYPSLEFKSKPMGAVLSLMPEPTIFRVSEVQFGGAVRYGSDPAADRYYDRIREALAVEGDPALEETRLKTLCPLIRKIGTLTRQFSQAGLYRYSPELSNYEFDFDRACPVLTDLDSTRELSELAPDLQMMQVLRDLASVTYRVLAKFYTPSVLGHYTFENLIEFDPLCALFQGYFPDTPQAELRAASRTFWNAWAPYYFLVNRYREPIQKEWDAERRRSYKMDHALFYILAMTKLFPIFKRSELFKRYPSAYTLDDLHAKAERFLGAEYAYFTHLYNA